MRVTEYGVEVTSRKTQQREVIMWRTDEAEVDTYLAQLVAGGRRDAMQVTRVVERADPTPIIHNHTHVAGSSSSYRTADTGLSYGMGLATGIALGELFQ